MSEQRDGQPRAIAAETQALLDAYAALNCGDVAGFVACFSPDVVRIEPGDHPSAGTYRGLEAVKAHVAAGRGTWAEGACEPQRVFVAGDKVVLLLKIHVRLKHETDWRDGETGDVFTFRDGKAIEFRTFWKPQDALEWAGVKDAD